MSTIDIRNEAAADIDYILFAEPRNEEGDYTASRIDIATHNDDIVYVDEANGSGDTVRLSVSDIPAFIKALQRAVALKQARK